MSSTLTQTNLNSNLSSESNASPQARAKRLRRLRKLTQKSRKEFSNEYKISPGTIQNWETARFGGLTEKGAKLMIYALSKEGIQCTFEWLMYGAGSPPILTKLNRDISYHAPTKSKRAAPLSFPNALRIELDKFYQLHPNATHFLIDDDTMSPHYVVGQVVAGLKIQGDSVASLIGECCILDTDNYGRIIRQIWNGTELGRYNLIALNLSPKIRATDQLIITNAAIKEAARIIWVRQDDVS